MKVDGVLEVLRDGEWHPIREVMASLGLDALRVLLVLSFLEKFNFVEIDRKTGRVKLWVGIQEFLEEIEAL